MSGFRRFTKKVLYYFLNAVEQRNGASVSGFSRGLQNVRFGGENKLADRCNFSGKIEIGYRTTLGYNNFLSGDITIGKYCQIGGDVAIHTTNHPISHLSTYINRSLFDGELLELKEVKKVNIGHDVWIGHNVIITGNVTVGNGAILAAGSVVTKDVPPYSIVGGVPAKIIRKRFSDAIIDEIEALQWWDLSDGELQKIKPLFFKDYKTASTIYG
ncbi:CatB-related O-acetyltransferase [Flavobacterium caeni]|uniref:Acetyltransferase (Isoleucine patch superfamily) n=1 Tax=Flavobacterium caeni TaxID=490189 RepID=A0A1G5FKW3_9FLAO|nr:CatB-related O-acetyltransferase [Flavobacterium caeni]SCY39843.1 Acetyltransferase (isoleucine patch superfamily) [Flavobacterium caeni]